MKQHITVKQLEELSEKGKERLVEWMYSLMPQPTKGSCYILPTDNDNQISFFMTIGQMIEFLLDQKKVFTGYDSLCETNGFHLHLNYGIEIFFNDAGEKEFCDALWEAVKEVLEK